MRLMARRLRSTSGQALVEMAIVMPTMIFFILGIVQLALMEHARLMLEYAAFTAARAGAVWNADKTLMEDAAVFVLTPTFGISAENGGLGTQVNRADDAAHFAVTYGVFQELNALSNPLLPKLVTVDVLNPTQESLGSQTEVDFDDPAQRALTQLTIRVRYYYNLRIPYANWIIWEAYMGANAGMLIARRVDGWYYEPSGQAGGIGGVTVDKRAGLAMVGFAAKAPNACYTNIGSGDMTALAILAQANTYLIPMVTTYTVRMQSNPIHDRLQKRSDVLGNCN